MTLLEAAKDGRAEWWPKHEYTDKHEVTNLAYDDGFADGVKQAMEAVAELMLASGYAFESRGTFAKDGPTDRQNRRWLGLNDC